MLIQHQQHVLRVLIIHKSVRWNCRVAPDYLPLSLGGDSDHYVTKLRLGAQVNLPICKFLPTGSVTTPGNNSRRATAPITSNCSTTPIYHNVRLTYQQKFTENCARVQVTILTRAYAPLRQQQGTATWAAQAIVSGVRWAHERRTLGERVRAARTMR